MATIREYFEKSFPNAISMDSNLTALVQNTKYPILVRVHVDFDSHAIFPSVLLPDVPEELLTEFISYLLQNPEMLIELRLRDDGDTTVTLPQGYSAMAGSRYRVEREDPFVRFIQKPP